MKAIKRWRWVLSLCPGFWDWDQLHHGMGAAGIPKVHPEVWDQAASGIMESWNGWVGRTLKLIPFHRDLPLSQAAPAGLGYSRDPEAATAPLGIPAQGELEKPLGWNC